MAKRFLRYFGIAIAITTAVAVVVALFSLVTQGQPTINHIFIANFIVGGIVICVGIFQVLYSPTAVRGGLVNSRQHQSQDFQTQQMLAAHKTSGDGQAAAKYVFIGICIIAITALVQCALVGLHIL